MTRSMKIEVILEEARRKGDLALDDEIVLTSGVHGGDLRYIEIQDGWISVWGGTDEMPTQQYLIDAGGVDPVRVWQLDGQDIHNDNWDFECRRASILSL